MQASHSHANAHTASPSCWVLVLALCWAGPAPAADPVHPRNLVFMIGDGMGLAHVSATRAQTVGPQGELNLDRFPVIGLVKTHAADALVTDSAASATALATGAKTRNGTIGLDPEGRALTTLIEAAHAQGKSTGIIVTSTVTHATPASFAAHVPSRTDEAAIALQLVRGPLDLLLGGGRSFFLPRNRPGSRRSDGLDVLREARKRGFKVVSTRPELARAAPGRLLGLFALDGIERSDPQAPTLSELTEVGIQRLAADPEGFVLMIEASQIDWAGHGNDFKDVVAQTRDFDAAVGVAYRFAGGRGDTLVVVTADHETGGLALLDRDTSGEVRVDWTTDQHTAVDVPLYAYGAGAQALGGVLENDEVGRRLARALGFGEFPRYE